MRYIANKMSGFTLIELLVVISIISLLMSITLPSLSRAREMGKRIDCQSNVRQLTLAWQMYVMDNDEKLCSSDTWFNNDSYGLPDYWRRHEPSWVTDGPDRYNEPLNYIGGTETAIKDGVLWHYVNSLKVYKCKSDRTGVLRNYSISSVMSKNDMLPDEVYNRQFATMGDIKGTSKEMVFIDADVYSGCLADEPWLHGSFWPFNVIKDPWVPVWCWQQGQSITARHSDGCNLSFADGHTEFLRWRDKRTVKFANSNVQSSNPSDTINNEDFDTIVRLLWGKIKRPY